MKKSRGTAFRARVQEPGTPAQEPAQPGKTSGRLKGFLAAGGAVILLILLILPCRYRRCGGPADGGKRAYRWVVANVSPGTVERRLNGARKGGYPPAYGMRHGAKRATPQRDAVPADKNGIHGPGNAEEKNAVKPADRSGGPGKIETSGRGAVKPDENRDRGEIRGADDGNAGKNPEKPKVYDFGTKLELVPAPSNR